jgi:hypothetical protein
MKNILEQVKDALQSLEISIRSYNRLLKFPKMTSKENRGKLKKDLKALEKTQKRFIKIQNMLSISKTGLN